MPTILFINGWRFFFYSNEGNEPIHIHVQKAESEAKFWILIDTNELKDAFSYNLSPANKREVKKMIYLNLDFIIEKWNSIHGKK
ncbi:MAG: DUF4160 domain-containing protein [Bacteroidota bacterium]